jgi:hypothetical protein
MSGAPTNAELVADLRGFVDYYGCDPGVPMSAVDTAAAAALALEALQDDMATMHRTVVHECCETLAALDALRPPCPHCGGTRQVWNDPATDPLRRHFHIDCPACSDGKVPWERLVRVFTAVHEDDNLLGYRDAVLHLRGI